ncbi:MAG: beta-propeller domain-containing protein [Clostridia bacterium]|nr:beta-propeller domain-containing protein [Clostridia bacterium]
MKKTRLFKIVLSIVLTGTLLALNACSVNADDTLAKISGKNADYREIYEFIKEKCKDREWVVYDGIDAKGVVYDVIESAALGAAAEESGSDFSTTNLQEIGVDEGDIIKTDGEYIFILSGNMLKIINTQGEKTELISELELTDIGNGEMYLKDNRIIIVGNDYSFASKAENMGEFSCYAGTVMSIVDISDKTNPEVISTSGQSGYYNTARMIGEKLYLISNYSMFYCDPDLSKPETFCPVYMRDGEFTVFPAEDISLYTETDNAGYTVITACNMDGEILSQKSRTTYTDNVYCSKDNLYIADTEFRYESGSGIYSTVISKYALNEGNVEFVAENRIDGRLLNQFSMSEKDGLLRAVTTTQTNGLTSKTDSEGVTWRNETWQSANLIILSEKLEELSKLENLSDNEEVKSVRFMGDYVYFVTFRQTDPLFCADAADPENPKILGELKLPGFSAYMHPWDENNMIGLGYDADEETGRTGDIKISMFDVSSPEKMKEDDVLLIDKYYSDVFGNHKAFLCYKEKNIIAFPAGTGYYVFSYNEKGGFKQESITEFEDTWPDFIRGLFIGENLYVISDETITVLDMADDFAIISAELY